MTDYIKKAFIVAALILLLLLTYLALNIALADLKHYPVKHWIQKIESGQVITKADIDKAIVTINSSIELAPSNAEYREYLARLHFLNAIDTYNNDSSNIIAFRGHLSSAYAQHKYAIKHRPQWPYSWANLALAKAHLQQFDPEFDNAISMAQKFGPWEIASNQAIAMAGLNGWNKITPASKANTITAIERTYQQNKALARNILSTNLIRNEICQSTALEQLKEDKFCKGMQ